MKKMLLSLMILSMVAGVSIARQITPGIIGATGPQGPAGTGGIPYVGATMDANLGSHALSTTGLLSVGTISITGDASSTGRLLMGNSVQDIFIGNGAGYATPIAGNQRSVGIGVGAVASLNQGGGDYAVGIGYNALHANTNPSESVAIGAAAANSLTAGYDDVAIGYQAMPNQLVENGSVMIGKDAGYNSQNNQSLNVFIGHKAGEGQTGSNHLVIQSSAPLQNDDAPTSYPLIFGDFSAGKVLINSPAQNSTISSTLTVNGTIEVQNGNMKFGTYTASGSTESSGYITIIDQNGIPRKLMVQP